MQQVIIEEYERIEDVVCREFKIGEPMRMFCIRPMELDAADCAIRRDRDWDYFPVLDYEPEIKGGE